MAQSQQNSTKLNIAIKPASGRSGPKVKSACRTCKLRKVKCDEGRPACNRCTTSGHICDGYGIWGGGGGSARHFGLPSTSTDGSANPHHKVRISRNEAKFPMRLADANSRLSKLQMTVSSPDTVTVGDCVQFAQTTHPPDFPKQSTSPKKHQSITSSIPPQVVEFPRAPQERSLLYWFQTITSGKLPGVFSSEFWKLLIPQACYSEPAVLYGVLALTSAHKNELLQPIPGQISAEERFTLQAYSKAIRYLQPHFRLDSNTSFKVTLITCILFVCLEMVQRRHANAVSHLSSGLKLITQSKRLRCGVSTEPYPSDYTSTLIDQAFLKLSLQVNMLGYSHFHSSFLLNRRTAEVVPSRFFSVEEAREHLDKLIARALKLSDLHRKQDLLQRRDQCTLSNQRISLREDLDSWFETYTVSEIETDLTLPPRSRAGSIILRMYHAMAVIIAEACHYPRQETIFDQQTSLFVSIMTYATKMWKIVSAWHPDLADESPGDKKGSIIDIGWIPAVYYTAIKCRIRRIRLHAIRLLEATYHTEGIWNATVAAQVAREVMRIEEGPEQNLCINNIFPFDSTPQQEELLLPALPESKRVHDVEVIHPSEGQRRVELVCRRKHIDGSWEDIHRQYDPIIGSWADKKY